MVALEILLIGSLLNYGKDGCETRTDTKPIRSIAEVELAETFRVRKLQGEILDPNGSPLSDVRVEVIRISEFGKGDVISTCTTVGDRLRLKGFGPGNYQLRFSLDGFDRTIVRVVVSKNAPKSNKIRFSMKASN